MKTNWMRCVRTGGVVGFVALAAALSGTACVSTPNPQPGTCGSGTGTLAFQNNSGEDVTVGLSDEAGALPNLAITEGQSLNETEPTGSYTVTATGNTTHVEIINESVSVTCDSNTPVLIATATLPTLSVGLSGGGKGSVSSAPSGLQCGASVCSAPFQYGASVVLTAQAQSGSTFKGWSGACSGTSTCTVTMSQSQSVTAQFALTQARPGPVTYFGGPIVRNPKIVSVLWNASVATEFVGAIPSFLQSVPSSAAFLSVLQQYTDSTGASIQAATFFRQITLTAAPTAKTVDDTDIQNTLTAAITSGLLPPNDANTIYLVTMPPGVTVTDQGSSSCQQFCAYHGTGSTGPVPNGALIYIVMPDMSTGACASGCSAGGSTLDTYTTYASKELADAMTDPDVGLANAASSDVGWFDSTVGDLGELCNGQVATLNAGGGQWAVQKLWSNIDNACVLPSPLLGTPLSGLPASQSAVAGGAAVTYTVTALSATVGLTAVGLPAGVTATFSPASIAAGAASTVSVQAAANVVPGNYLFAVQGASGTTTASSGVLGLTVTAAGH